MNKRDESKELLIKFLDSMDFPMEHMNKFVDALKNAWLKSKDNIFENSVFNDRLEQILGLLEDISNNGG